MYKGHINYDVKENDNNMYHCHPYSIAKIMGHSIVDFYRSTYGLPFSNGIVFSIEPKYKNGNFLLRKISDHSKKWKETFEPIKLGSLDSYRNILHASDAAKAIKLILEQPNGETYIISGNERTKNLDIVLKVYSNNGIIINVKDNVLYSGDKIVAFIEIENKGIDTVSIDIRGNSNKLKQLGWTPNYNIENIIKELC
jgi:GDPmannose 4,6-dehydratase